MVRQAPSLIRFDDVINEYSKASAGYTCRSFVYFYFTNITLNSVFLIEISQC